MSTTTINMNRYILLSALFLLSLLITPSLCFISPKEVQGTRFVDSNSKEPFIIKGLDYQPGGSSSIRRDSPEDPLSNIETCKRDVALFQTLGVNTIRVYSINPNLNHDACMTTLALAGIYLLLDLNSPLWNEHLNRHDPETSYNAFYLDHIFKVVDQFSGYNNTLGFFAGNEVINDRVSASKSSKYVKRIVTDLKMYMMSNRRSGMRTVPIGYSAADDLQYRVPVSKYLECSNEGGDDSSSIDFYGVNSYQWCGSQTMQTSGYDKLVEAYRDFTKPVFLSEFGCNKVLPREFNEITVLYTGEMLEVFSGGLVYEFSQEPNNYGLVKLSSTDGSARILRDYEQLRKKYAEINREELVHTKSTLQSQSQSQSPYCSDPEIQAGYEPLKLSTVDPPTDYAEQVISRQRTSKRGQYIDMSLHSANLTTKYDIYDLDGVSWSDTQKSIKVVNQIEVSDSDSDSNNSNNNATQTRERRSGPGRGRGRGNSNSNSDSNSTTTNGATRRSLHGYSALSVLFVLLIALF